MDHPGTVPGALRAARPRRAAALSAAALLAASLAGVRPARADDVRAGEELFGSSSYETEKSSASAKYPTPFAVELSKRLDWPLDKLETIERKGFGRTEMVSFVAVARKSTRAWDDLVKDREKGAPLKRLAEEAGLDYAAVYRESRRIKRETDFRVTMGAVEDVVPSTAVAAPGTAKP